jgi:hypothetical protein
MTAVAGLFELEVRPRAVRLEDLGELAPISRVGGQGRVYRPQLVPASLGPGPFVVKRYRRTPPPGAERVLADMVAWGRALPPDQQAWLHGVTAWPLAVVHAGALAAGIVMRDVSPRFAAPFVMPSGKRERVLLTLEHLLGADGYLELRGLGVRLDTERRALVAERVSRGLDFLHRHGIAASDIAPNNLLVAFEGADATICFIDCDSMAFRGRSALEAVQTGDWDIPPEFGEAPDTRAADAYKLGLVILRLFARSHDARALAPNLRYVPVELRDLLYRALGDNAVNRPAPGEWQRALRGLLADGRLNERYPGPAAAPRISPAVADSVSPADEPAPVARPVLSGPARGRLAGPRPVRALSAVPSPAATRPAAAWALAAANSTSAALWLRRAVIVLWIVAGSAVLLVVLSRLFAAAVPAPDAGVAGNTGAGVTPYYQYSPGSSYYPGGGGGRIVPGGPTGNVQIAP